MVGMASPLGRAAPSDPAEDPSAVVVIGDLEWGGALAAAGLAVPRHWRLETLTPRATPALPRAQLDMLARTYREADFLRCLDRVDRALDPDILLERGHRAEAARAGTLAAACALGAGDEGHARDVLRRLSVREMVEPDLLRGTTPSFQRIADEERQAAQRRGWVAVDVRTDPEGAAIHVNGVKRCPAAPCRVHVLRGEHVLVAEKLGQQPRTVTPVIEGDHALTIKLDPASAQETRHQLAAVLGEGMDPSAVDIPRATASAYGVGLLVLVWARDWQVHAAAYQAGSATLTHVAVDGRDEAAPRAIAAALHGWRATLGSQTQARAVPASLSPLSVIREFETWSWGVAVAFAFASIALAFRLHRSKVRHGVAVR